MLTAIDVRNAKPKEKAYEITNGNGLYLHIPPAERKRGDTDLNYRVLNQPLFSENTRKWHSSRHEQLLELNENKLRAAQAKDCSCTLLLGTEHSVLPLFYQLKVAGRRLQ